MHHVRYKSKNNEKENMKEEKIPCRIIRYREFPDLLFGTLREDGPVYFDAASGHLLIDECLALLFVVYIDPAFGVYLLERVDELLSGGFTVSDTWLVQAAGLRFTKEELTQILEQHETQHI